MQLRIPGPTPLPDEVMEAMNRNMISHRGAEFHAAARFLQTSHALPSSRKTAPTIHQP